MATIHLQAILRLNASDTEGLRREFSLILINWNGDDGLSCFLWYWIDDDRERSCATYEESDWLYVKEGTQYGDNIK